MKTFERNTSRRTTFQEERARLFATPTSSSSKSSIANDAASLQQSLARTQKLLSQELERVSHVASAIEQDGKVLDKTMTQHQTMNVKQAKKALTALEREQQKEQRILMASVFFFWCVVAYVLWGRILTHVPLFDRTIQLLSKLVQLPLRKVIETTNQFRQTEL
ncbi:hypothetical protein MPSEU_000352100 [Mayamaea pseudoterrestris]|nr:hypothetical protein MPSEU_000352100 [Mayamaea pseudoterrestris]